jgi:soluble lytic murein transglycosylase-like protein
MTKAADLVFAAMLRLSGADPASMEAVRLEALAPQIVEASEIFEFDAMLVTALIWRESRFDQYARNERSGAVGYLQLVRGGAVPNALGHLSDESLMEVRRNLIVGMAHLSRLRGKCQRGPIAYLSLWDGLGSCRPSGFSREVVATWKRLRKELGP